MQVGRPIVFLHLPKCAGQSVRAFLSAAFPRRALFPGQLDRHLALYARSDLNQFEIFSGHFSWSLLDCLGPEALVFTVLRNPEDRLISFYKFLRRTGATLDADTLNNPGNRAIRLSLTSPLESFLDSSDQQTRDYILSTFDNYYTYYFGTRVSNGRYLIRDNYPEGDYFITESISQIAIRNLRFGVRVYNVDGLGQLVSDLAAEPGFVAQDVPVINTDPDATLRTRQEQLQSLSENLAAAQEKLHLFCQFDIRVYNAFCN